MGMVSNTILVVDDDGINRGILRNLFSAQYEGDEAENGREGLEKILTGPEAYCAVLLDVRCCGGWRPWAIPSGSRCF